MTDVQDQAGRPLENIVAEAERVLAAGSDAGVPLRLVGGLAIHLNATGEGPPPLLRRDYKDIDLVTAKGKAKPVSALLRELGYDENAQFNLTNGNRRLLFYDPPHGRQVDVFVGGFEMCHHLPIADRLDVHPRTVPLAELLLTKLQIYHLNEKDQRDVLALVHDHEVGEGDDGINASHIARLCAADWGLWRTCKLNVERIRDAAGEYGLGADAHERIEQRLDTLWQRIEAEPKSTKWKLRSRVGDRVRWYEEPEEVG